MFSFLVIMASSSTFQIPAIEKLKARENYSDWAFAVEAYLKHEGLWAVVQGKDEGDRTDPDANRLAELAAKDEKARSKIILLVHPVNYNHIRTCTSAKVTWTHLKKTFEDSGLYRRVSLIRQLTSTKLDECRDIEDYVNKIVLAAHKLRQIDGNSVSDDWLATFLLTGLSQRYDPMIMTLENSNIDLTSDVIKTKLLQDVKLVDSLGGSSSLQALFSKGNRRHGKQHTRTTSHTLKPTQSLDNTQSGIRCYVCQQIGHIS